MHECVQPLYIWLASILFLFIVGFIVGIGLATALARLFYYADYGWAALKRKKKEEDNEQTR